MKTLFFESIGTKWEIDVYSSVSNGKLKLIERAVLSFLNDFTNTYSRFEKNSLVTEISKKTGDYEFPKSSKDIFKLYEKLYRLTKGSFTPLIGNTLDSLGYDPSYSLKPRRIEKPVEWNEAIAFNYPILNVKKKVILDFGGCGKGYAIDRVFEILEKNNLKSFLINAGGDIRISNYKAKIGLENPFDSNSVIGTATLDNKSICASAQNRRTWGRYSHILNPSSKNFQTEIAASWIVSARAFEADAIATAVFFSEPEVLKKEFSFEYLILKKNMTVEKSKNFKAEIYYN